MGMSSSVFQRFILASRLSNGRGLPLETFDFELLLRTMMQSAKDERKCTALHWLAGTLTTEEKYSALHIKLHNRTTFEPRPRDYHLGFRAIFRAASVPRPFAAREVCSSLNLRLA